MLPSLVIALAVAARVVLAAPPTALPAPTVQAATTNRLAADVARLERQHGQKLADKRALERSYEEQLHDLDRLKRSKATWRRDREIRSRQADSQTTAERLSQVDVELRGLDAQLRRRRQALRLEIDRELAAQPFAARRAELERMRGQVVAALQPRVRKILVPDDTLDELADPEELVEQIALLQQAEVELRRERDALRQREDRYARMARLRDQRERASQMGELEEELVRRSGGRDRPSTLGDGGEPRSPPASPTPPPEDTAGSPGFSPVGGEGVDMGGPIEDTGFEQSSILLTDVVDASTIDALRRAGRPSSAKARAATAAHARRQVDARLQRLERSRALIERHLSKLRQGP